MLYYSKHTLYELSIAQKYAKIYIHTFLVDIFEQWIVHELCDSMCIES